jgi:hypothetical protein
MYPILFHEGITNKILPIPFDTEIKRIFLRPNLDH